MRVVFVRMAGMKSGPPGEVSQEAKPSLTAESDFCDFLPFGMHKR